MASVLRWVGYLVVAFVLLALLAAAWVWLASSLALRGEFDGRAERLAKPTPAQLADGSRQLKVMGCISCHGEGLRGDLLFSEPGVATIHAPNLTLIAARANDQQLARALRQGIGADGRPLFAMPSAQYSRMSDAEVSALIGAIRALPVGGKQVAPISVGLKGRIGLAMGKFRSQPEMIEHYHENMPAEVGPQFARGRHLAMINCSECHGPTFAGSQVKPGVNSPDLIVAGGYDLPEFKRLMRTGVPTGNRKLGMMGDIARSDFSHMTDDEIEAIHAYLSERANRTR